MTTFSPTARSYSWRHFDPVILVAALALTGYGALLIYSAALPRGATGVVISEPVIRHIVAASAGVAVMLLAARTNYRVLDTFSWFAYGAAILLLLSVFFLGSDRFSANRWFDLGFVTVQASELAKVLTIVALAKFMSDRRDQMGQPRVFLQSLGLVALPAGLVFIEPDLGGAILFFVIWAVMAAFAGARLRAFAVLATVALALVPFGLIAGVSEYQRDRVRIFIDPARDELGTGFNVLQAETSVGAGGLFGKGLTEGTQTQLDFLQTQQTDFIFSVLGEELGFVGAMALFVLFLLLIFRLLRAILKAPDTLGRLVVAGIVTMVAVQAFVAVGVNIRLVPVTGLPLPFISVGNSALLVLFAALGIVQSVLMRQDER